MSGKKAKFINCSNRSFVVINGQAYYRSTGYNSGLEGTWFPIIMCQGNIITKFDINFPEHFNEDKWRELLSINNNGYIIKYDRLLMKNQDSNLNVKKIDDIFNQAANINNNNDDDSENKIDLSGRMIQREHLIISAKLGGGIWNKFNEKNKLFKALKISSTEEQYINEAIILEDTASCTTDDPDELNCWLIEHGAKEIYNLLKFNEKNSALLSLTVLRKINRVHTILQKMSEPSSSWHSLFNIKDNNENVKKAVFNRLHIPINELKSKLLAITQHHLSLKKITYNVNNNLTAKISHESANYIESIMDNKSLTDLSEQDIKSIEDFCQIKLNELKHIEYDKSSLTQEENTKSISAFKKELKVYIKKRTKEWKETCNNNSFLKRLLFTEPPTKLEINVANKVMLLLTNKACYVTFTSIDINILNKKDTNNRRSELRNIIENYHTLNILPDELEILLYKSNPPPGLNN